MGDDVLVGRDDRLAGAERGGDQRPRRLVAAHDLDDDVGVGVGHEVGRGIGQERRVQAVLAGPIESPDGDAGEGQRPAVERAQPVGMLDRARR